MDTAYSVANQHSNAIPGWQYAYSVGSPAADWPLSTTTGTILGAYTRKYGGTSLNLAAYGVDFSNVTFSGASFKSNGFSVDGSGLVTAANLFASSTNALTAVGQGALTSYFNTSPTSGETATGNQALKNATSSVFDTAFGYHALRGSVTVSSAGSNSALGYNVLAINSSGTGNGGFGTNALTNNTTGSFNNAFGVNALNANAGGGNNSAFGHFSLSSNVSGTDNSAFGSTALLNNTASANSAFGSNALRALTSGGSNAAFGFNALKYQTTGANNTALGYQAGLGVTAISDTNTTIDSDMTFVGYEASRNSSVASTTPLTNGTAIGYLASVACSNCLVLGGVGANGVNVGIGTTTPYSRLTVWGTDTASTTILSVVNSASTTVFASYGNGNATYSGSIFQSSDQRLKTNITALDSFATLALVDQLNPVSYNRIDQPDQGTNLGFIAQEVQKIFPTLVSTSSPTTLTPNGTLTLNYQGLIAPLVKAVQALSNEIASIENTIAGFATVFHTNELCVGSTCVTPAQFQAMVAAAEQSGTAPASGIAITSASSTPPVIQIIGNNPAIINVGDIYSDLGATIIAPAADNNLNILTYLNGVQAAQIVIDTSQVATDTIDYVVTDQSGLTSTSTRTVIIEPATSTTPSI